MKKIGGISKMTFSGTKLFICCCQNCKENKIREFRESIEKYKDLVKLNTRDYIVLDDFKYIFCIESKIPLTMRGYTITDYELCEHTSLSEDSKACLFPVLAMTKNKRRIKNESNKRREN